MSWVMQYLSLMVASVTAVPSEEDPPPLSPAVRRRMTASKGVKALVINPLRAQPVKSEVDAAPCSPRERVSQLIAQWQPELASASQLLPAAHSPLGL